MRATARLWISTIIFYLVMSHFSYELHPKSWVTMGVIVYLFTIFSVGIIDKREN